MSNNYKYIKKYGSLKGSLMFKSSHNKISEISRINTKFLSIFPLFSSKVRTRQRDHCHCCSRARRVPVAVTQHLSELCFPSCFTYWPSFSHLGWGRPSSTECFCRQSSVAGRQVGNSWACHRTCLALCRTSSSLGKVRAWEAEVGAAVGIGGSHMAVSSPCWPWLTP